MLCYISGFVWKLYHYILNNQMEKLLNENLNKSLNMFMYTTLWAFKTLNFEVVFCMNTKRISYRHFGD